MFCPYCGNELMDGVRFCPVCGGEVSSRSVYDTMMDELSPDVDVEYK